jgi:hypothetical protein
MHRARATEGSAHDARALICCRSYHFGGRNNVSDVVIDKGAIHGVAGKIEQSKAELASLQMSTSGGGAAFGAADVQSAFEAAARVHAALIEALASNTGAIGALARSVAHEFDKWDTDTADAAGR